MNDRTLLIITEYSYSYTKEIKPDGIVTDLYNRSQNIQSKPKLVILDN